MAIIDQLARDVLKSIEKSEDNILEIPIKQLATIFFPNQRVNGDQISAKLIKMKLRYDTLDYVVVMTRDPIFRFYKIKPEPKETQLIDEEKKNDATTTEE